MTDWKKEVIDEYISYQKELTYVMRERSEDAILKELTEKKETIERELNEAYKPYEAEIADYHQHIEELKQKLLTRWDLESKTFKCGTGSATIRTTKSLIVTDKMALIDRLIEILNNKQKAFDCIRSFDLTTIRKYMDVDLIAWSIAHYDEKHSVVIKGTEDK
jgi:hypothetical protein